jgi:hypothetical protein
MTVLGSKVVYELTSEQIKEFAKEIIAQDRALSKPKQSEPPMTKQETAKFLKCSTDTVDRRFGHLRHVVPNGPIYWYASELENFIKGS